MDNYILIDYTLEMFGRKGWICQNCNNFNYETRKKCNKCHINKKMVKLYENYNSAIVENKIFKKGKDWLCDKAIYACLDGLVQDVDVVEQLLVLRGVRGHAADMVHPLVEIRAGKTAEFIDQSFPGLIWHRA